MTLARFLSRGKGGLPSLVTMIDRQLVIQASTLYSQRAALLALNKLRDALNTPGYKIADVQELLESAWVEVMRPRKRDPDNIHASELLTACPRKLYYQVNKVPRTNEEAKLNATSEKHFWVGSAYHKLIQDLLKKAGVLVQAEVPVRNYTLHITSHADGLLQFHVGAEPYILEIKTCNSFAFKNICKTGRPTDAHLYQGSIYAKELCVEKILFLYINKDTGEMKEILVTLSQYQEYQQDAYRKIHLVNDAVTAGIPPDRLCRIPTEDRALTCPYCDHCFNL